MVWTMKTKTFIDKCMRDRETDYPQTLKMAFELGVNKSLHENMDDLMSYCPHICERDPETCDMLPVYCPYWKTGIRMKVIPDKEL